MTKMLVSIHDMIWGAPALILIIGVGFYLSLRTGFAQFRLFPSALKTFGKMLMPSAEARKGTSFRALCTALGATVGIGNLVGVAGAICLGGPGAIFWMWMCGLLGMITKYAEVVLALRYRTRQGKEYTGGPMYVILRGMGKRWRWLAWLYALFGLLASFGVGNAAQVNAVTSSVLEVLNLFGIPECPVGNLLLGCFLAIFIGWILSGGTTRIGSIAQTLVPILSAGYILLCLGVLLAKWDQVPMAFASIIQGAFSPKAATGGLLGSAFQALKAGCSRGVFTNEAGMGTASIAHASASVAHPAEQGMMGIMEVFLDTIVICTLTALVILVSGVFIPYGHDLGGQLTTAAFSSIYGSSAVLFLAIALCCFAFASIVGWGLYGLCCAQYLFGASCWKWFVMAQAVMTGIGSVINTETVWLLAETVNGMMAIPNLIALAVLTPEVVRLTIDYKEKTGYKEAGGGNYANIHQRKSLRTFSHAEIPPSGGGSEKRRKKDLPSEYRPA